MKSSLTRLLAVALAMAPAMRAQFSSGSTGSDGALNLITPGTVVFDPVAMGLNPAGDNIFNFTTINIAAGVTVVMTADVLRNRAVVWLATGNVTIGGTLAMQGADGAPMVATNPGMTRVPAMPGPGGYPGGVGAYLASAATNGSGLGGGVITANNGGQGGYSYNSNQLVPLVGGSGGAGGQLVTNGVAGGNGGAGGGAIRIVSSTSITVSSNGAINAYGGAGGGGLTAYGGGAGSGGAIHLIAPTVTNAGTLDVSRGNPIGVIKVSANTANIGGAVYYNAVIGPLYNPPLPTSISSVKVVSVGGVAAPPDVMGSLLAPDFTVTTSPVTVNIAAQYIPVGTVVKLYLTAEQGNDSVVTCAALAGTQASSTAACTGASFPQGVTIADIRAVW